jgi:hypothetical protein
MGFFDKIKQFLGIGTVKVKIEANPSISKSGNSLSGKLHLSAKSDQHILSLEVKLEEQWETGSGDDKTVKEFELGIWEDKTEFDMKANEDKTVDFTFNYELVKSENDRLADSAGSVGKALGGLGKMMNSEKSTYRLIATCDVKGAAFDPNDIFEVKLTD